MALWTDYVQKESLEDEDTLLVYDSTERDNKQVTLTNLHNYEKEKLESTQFTLETKEKTLPLAINELKGRSDLTDENVKKMVEGTLIVGEAKKVNGHTVNSDVPENAAFTDTVYDDTKVREDIGQLKEDISNKITKFYASNQGETHITDSDSGKIQDMMIYGKSSQDGTPTPENPVEIKSVVNPTVKVTNEDGLKVQSITLNNITLNAIPVSSGGNVTINGQQYAADYVDVERGKVVRMCERETFNTKNGDINEEYRLSINVNISAQDDGNKECIFSTFEWTPWTTCVVGTKLYIKNIKKPNNELYTAQELKELGLDFYVIYQLAEKQEIDLTTEQITAFKELVTYYPVTNVSVNSEQLDGYTVFNYSISMANGWNYVKKQLNDNRDYIYDMDTQSAEAYVNSEYAVALTELEV